MKQFFVLFIFFVSLTTTIISCNSETKKEKPSSDVNTDVYECPMKCNNGQTYDKPGTCPVCGMDLEKVIKT